MKKNIQSKDFQRLAGAFDKFVKVRNYKQGRSNLYRNIITEFLIWLEQAGVSRMQNVTSKESVKYLEYLTARPKKRGNGVLAEKTIKLHLFVQGLFQVYLLENKEIQNIYYIPSVSGETQKPRNILTIEEIKLVYQYAENEMEKALLSIAYGCGLRRSEIANLDLKDVSLIKGMIVVRQGKGNKRREVPMSDTVLEYLKKYIRNERPERLSGRNQNEEAFFINSRGRRSTGENLNEILSKMIEQTGKFELVQKEITLHCLRHSIAFHLAENNAGIDFIRSFLGHTQINTTYIYAVQNKKRKPVVNF
ncbi:tyrosine-type recombinase/integrase [Flavobacterium johnsoniae]|uniref:Phage integrase family protein n=1 Tax=Flavobacterium johnsoniae (strain ATCC 17061 / DSM 2064 / JCM 8514 / BCRC 14874 / CCUG 350202 / NBRC 14942 / NCIMB 11054 / UW101) TaxID=376686 RepID=A5FDU2_FLAJ1|nr:tyrosine-type recombinase/integrase [Flavobacterium johnsoniae]ABQ06631.1 phage integrase family protein [Flavobacterium johnsoniae UW101]OXE99868.1 integrase [Flavobacterium johnsoniae UW101]WQG82383.1 tyrosine-type recombinase/integrase [Flavobacterium johnsoniae UW101]SHL99600.1 Site-specific recombinase XerD [Flavobacterium johnsoniae]